MNQRTVRAALLLLAIAGCGTSAPSSPAATRAAPADDRASRCASLAITPSAAWALLDVRRPDGLRRTSRFSTEPGAPAFIEPPSDWHLPESVTFSILGAPRVEPDRVTVRADLVNASDAPQTVYLWDAGLGLFGLTLLGDGVGRTPLPPGPQRPEVYPDSSQYVLPPHARWAFETSAILSCYTFRPGQSATLRWNFNTHGQSLTGDLPVTLPE